MRIGIIDLGTNSVRFDVRELRGKETRKIHSERLMVRLGQGFFLKGEIDQSALARTIHALTHFKRVSLEFNVTKLVAFATATLREASNTQEIVDQIYAQSGVRVRVISGIEEARLIALGVLSNEKLPKSRFAIVDIGGGSTEVIVCSGRRVLQCESFPLGTARLQQIFLKRNPPKPEAIESLREYMRSLFREISKTKKFGKTPLVIGSSGTIKALARLLRKKNSKEKGAKAQFPKNRLTGLNRKMGKMSAMELMGVPGMEAKRVDMILAGSILLEEVLKFLGAAQVRPTDFSLRDGIFEEELRLLLQDKESHLKLHEEAVFQKAMRFGLNEEYVRSISQFSGRVFDKLASVHKLNASWKSYLQFAAVLRKIGLSVSPIKYEDHTYYMVKNAEFPSMAPWESELIARLCKAHGGSKFNPKDNPYKKGTEARSVFERLLAILRIVDAVDTRSNTYVKLTKVQVGRTQIQMSCKVEQPTGLEVARIKRKRELFEKIFKKFIFVNVS